MKRYCLLLIAGLAGISWGANVSYQGFKQYTPPGTCGSNGQFMTSNGDCTLAWTSQTPASSLYTTTGTWSAQQDYTGNVGIGETTTPARQFEIQNNASNIPQMRLTSSTHYVDFKGDNGGNLFLYPGGGVMVLNASFPSFLIQDGSIGTDTQFGYGISNYIIGGNLGINTATPSTQLHLSSGTFTIDGNVSPAITILGSGAPTNDQALCLHNGQLGHCTSIVGAGGGCTCTAP